MDLFADKLDLLFLCTSKRWSAQLKLPYLQLLIANDACPPHEGRLYPPPRLSSATVFDFWPGFVSLHPYKCALQGQKFPQTA